MRHRGKWGLLGLVLLILDGVPISCSKSRAQFTSSAQPVMKAPNRSARARETEPKGASSTASSTVLAAINALERGVDDYRRTPEDAPIRAFFAQPAPDAPLTFAPNRARYYDRVKAALDLSPWERERLDKQGVVQLDAHEGRSMAQQYLAIYAADLPVLVTTDSILDAVHRSYDRLLLGLETSVFLPLLRQLLERSYDQVVAASNQMPSAEREPFCDAGLYLTVALALLDGKGTHDPLNAPAETAEDLPRLPGCDLETDRDRLLDRIAELTMGLPDRPCTELYGSERCIDYSQFRPRGHYAGNPPLEAYFRAMMWLGREDTGFRLTPRGQGKALPSMVTREARAALVLSFALAKSKGIERLDDMDRALALLVGQSEFLGPKRMQDTLAMKRIATLKEGFALGESLALFMAEAAPTRGVRSQITTGTKTEAAPFDATFQLFGQRFLIDALVLTNVVYDKVEKRRMLPSGLDLMAALGDREAVHLLESELSAWGYAAQLWGARRAVETFYAQPQPSFHHRWLRILQTLDEVPAHGNFPQAMRTEAWRRKTLQTKLSAWSQLRRDNVLYAAQSYTSYALCEYPAGYVEPYPAFFRMLADSLGALEAAIRELDTTLLALPTTDRQREKSIEEVRHVEAYCRRARELLGQLEELAAKELAGTPFSEQEEAFLKSTIQQTLELDGCTARVLYTGWYSELVIGAPPADFDPIIADVHASQVGILHEGVGDNELLVAAIDNGKDVTIYVGPTYTHYEFTAPERLTDEQWAERLRTRISTRPEWVRPLSMPAPSGGAQRPRLKMPLAAIRK